MHFYISNNNNNDYINDSSSTDYNSTTGSVGDNTSIIINDNDNDDNDDNDNDNDDNDNDDDDDSDSGIEYDSILVEDSLHFYSEKNDKQYYIGLSHIYNSNNSQHLLLSTSVSAQVFFKHSYDNINNYLYYYGLTRIPNHQVQILQINKVEEQGYEIVSVVNKTYWLRIIQRHWKKIYSQRINNIRNRMLPQNILYKENHGIYPTHVMKLPSLHGMLSCYHNTSEQS